MKQRVSNTVCLASRELPQNFLVDIGGPFPALLPMLSFEGATRRNRPNLKAGDLVYCRVTSAYRDAEPQLSCVDAMGKAAGFGGLKDGVAFCVSTAYARLLLGRTPHPVLSLLAKGGLQFEAAVGVNGRAWIHSASNVTTVLVINAVQGAEFLNAAQTSTLVSRYLTSMAAAAASAPAAEQAT